MINQKQKERQQRGDDFQDEIRRSWSLVRSWRMRIADGKGGSRPADELVILETCNILAEMKRTNGDRFEMSFLRPSQIKGLLDFGRVFDQNYGLVFISFLNEAEGRDEAYAFQLEEARKYMDIKQRRYITLEEIRCAADGILTQFRALELPRITVDGLPGYDLKGLILCFKYV